MKPTYHVTVATLGRRTMAEEPADLRSVIRALVRPSRGEVVLFGAVDDHTHSVVESDQPAIFARDQARALRAALPGLELQAPHVKPIESRSHYERLVGYLLGQPSRHGLSTQNALWEGSCFLDLLGARLLPGYDGSQIARALPRLRRRDLLRLVGLVPVPIEPAGDEALHRIGPARIADLAAWVYAVGGLTGRSEDVLYARALAVQTSLEVGYPLVAIAPYVGVGSRGAQRAGHRHVDQRAALALRRRLAIEERCHLNRDHRLVG